MLGSALGSVSNTNETRDSRDILKGRDEFTMEIVWCWISIYRSIVPIVKRMGSPSVVVFR